MNAREPSISAIVPLQETGRNLFMRAYEGGAGTTRAIADLERQAAMGMLREFESSLRGLVRGRGGSIAELVERLRREVETGISSAEEEALEEIGIRHSIFRDAETLERDRKRVTAVAKFVRTKVESSLSALSLKGADAAVSFVLRTAEAADAGKEAAEKEFESRLERTNGEKQDLERRLSKLNGTLRESIAKFTSNRKAIAGERDAAILEKGVAISERDAAIIEKNAAVTEKGVAMAEKDEAVRARKAAEEETALAKRLYSRVSERAKEADRIAEILKKYGCAEGAAPADAIEKLLPEVLALRNEAQRLRQEQTSYQKTTARNFELEAQAARLNKTVEELENSLRREMAARRDAEEIASGRTKSKAQAIADLRDSSRSFFAVMARMDGADPAREDYADYDRLSDLLYGRLGEARTVGCEDPFMIACREMEAAKKEWIDQPPLLKQLGLSRVALEAAYEKCVREVGRMVVPESIRNAAKELKIYGDVAGITGRFSRSAVIDAEVR